MKSNLFKCTVYVFASLILSSVYVTWGYSQESEIANFPNRPITYIVPVPPGGKTDLISRLIAKEAEKYLKQPIVILNKPGGALTIGTTLLASAKPDGYTIGHFGLGSQILVPILEKIPYHPVKDFTPILQYAAFSLFGASVRDDSPFKSFKDLIAYARQNPKKLNYGTNGAMSHGFFITEQIARIEKVQFTHIPFKGGTEVDQALLGGHVHFGAGDLTLSLLEAKSIRPLLFYSQIRSDDFPSVPILKDFYDLLTYDGVLIAGPKNLPKEIIAKLGEGFGKAMKEPSFISGMKNLGMPIVALNHKEASDYIARSYEGLAEIVKEFKK
jgi:tripartite-type tricarboxylate transporter receptor subunit TctC